MSELSNYIEMQNTRIDIARMKGQESCVMVLLPSQKIRDAFIHYYTQIIGYKIECERIYFNKLNRLITENLPTDFVIVDGEKKRKMLY